jgi:hypothetical protein
MAKLVALWRERAGHGREMALIPGAVALSGWLDRFMLLAQRSRCVKIWRSNAPLFYFRNTVHMW